ncbi:Uncharacterised protein [Shewanella baltica]|uniref:hypothetical protein n=1 Tax=Shewanella TaxID=22 RepID=UPI000F6C636C|nr:MULTISPECIES: hypothetical protein [Shewanella]WAL78294.1 hypothetical protein OX890_19530 [Shewanella sp. DAU305]VEF27468.1 Uncharacterised protein [Shewanella baltica]
MKRISNDKDIQNYITWVIKKHHWVFSKGKKHSRLFSKSGKRITVPVTPSDCRAYKNLRKDIERIIKNETC